MQQNNIVQSNLDPNNIWYVTASLLMYGGNIFEL